LNEKQRIKAEKLTDHHLVIAQGCTVAKKQLFWMMPGHFNSDLGVEF